MFNKSNTSPTTATDTKKKVQTAKASSAGIPSILGKDIIIAGDIKTKGDVQIDGRVEGNVIANHVMIGEHGAVNGKISAMRATIKGKVTGKIDSGTVELAETANVQADIIQDHLAVANGAFFDGKCSRKSGGNITKPKVT